MVARLAVIDFAEIIDSYEIYALQLGGECHVTCPKYHGGDNAIALLRVGGDEITITGDEAEGGDGVTAVAGGAGLAIIDTGSTSAQTWS